MQLANQREHLSRKTSPSICAALIDSLFETPGRCLWDRLRDHHRGHDRAHDRQRSHLWHASRFSLVGTGVIRAIDLQLYKRAHRP